MRYLSKNQKFQVLMLCVTILTEQHAIFINVITLIDFSLQES